MRVGIVGTGFVGSTAAFALIMLRLDRREEAALHASASMIRGLGEELDRNSG